MSPRRTPAATTATGKPTRARPSRSRSVMSNLHSIVPGEQSHRRLEVGPDLPVAGLAPGRGRSRDRTMAAPPGRGNPTTTRRRQRTGQLPRGRKTSRRRVTLRQVSGAWAGRPAHGIPCFSLRRPSCAARLTPGGYCYCSRAPLGAASRPGRRRCQVRWSLSIQHLLICGPTTVRETDRVTVPPRPAPGTVGLSPVSFLPRRGGAHRAFRMHVRYVAHTRRP
jgi:hypothetical protein